MTEQTKSGIGSRLRAGRERLGWNREALAFHAGISWSAIAQIESGRRTNVRPGTLSALASALGVSIDYLVSGKPASPLMLEHRAFLYRDDEEFLGTAGPFLAEGIERSEALLALTNKANTELLRDHLGSDARGVEFIDSAAWYTAPGVALDALLAFVNSRVEAGAAWARVIGEPVWGVGSDWEVRRWMRYEALVNVAMAGLPATILCHYDESSVDPEVLEQARETHPETVGRDGIKTCLEYTEPGAFVLKD
jgi:transcriptional regulator with XRE-family HTH domain